MPDVRQKTGGCMTEELFQKGTGAGRGAVHEPGGCTVEELNRLGPEGIPEEYVTSSHLVYNSPRAAAAVTRRRSQRSRDMRSASSIWRSVRPIL